MKQVGRAEELNLSSALRLPVSWASYGTPPSFDFLMPVRGAGRIN